MSRWRCLGQQPGNTPEILEGSTFSNLREVIMTMSEYEERFRPPAPSLHQTFTEVRGPDRPSPPLTAAGPSILLQRLVSTRLFHWG